MDRQRSLQKPNVFQQQQSQQMSVTASENQPNDGRYVFAEYPINSNNNMKTNDIKEGKLPKMSLINPNMKSEQFSTDILGVHATGNVTRVADAIRRSITDSPKNSAISSAAAAASVQRTLSGGESLKGSEKGPEKGSGNTTNSDIVERPSNTKRDSITFDKNNVANNLNITNAMSISSGAFFTHIFF